MSGIRQHQPPWLVDHVIFFTYRWLSWGVALAIVLWFGNLRAYLPELALVAVLNLLATAVAQRYVRVVRRNPSLLMLDLVLAALVLATSNGWSAAQSVVDTVASNSDPRATIAWWLGPFGLYLGSALVLPALLFGWRGGLMAGLSFVTLALAAIWVLTGSSPAHIVASENWLALALVMVGPPIFGSLLPSLVALLRHGVAAQASRARRRPPFSGARFDRVPPADTPSRFAPTTRDPNAQRDGLRVAPFAAPTTAVRATEQGTEEARRVLFAPFPALDMELPAALDLLATRFGQHMGAALRVTLLGRARYVQRAHRAVLVRLTQEALLNVQQHAHAGNAELTLRYDAHSVALLIQDDGVGLLDGTYERPGLHALRAMHYRLAELGGRLDVFETEGGGVTVRATMPLE